jgi:type I restriction-modification system DNA methylase subunit
LCYFMDRNGKINANHPYFNFPMTSDPELYRHKEWLGLLQPVGLVVSPIALVKAQVILNRSRAVELQQRLESLVIVEEEMTWMADFPAFAQQVLEWLPEDLSQPPPELEVSLPDYGETLRPDYAVKDPDSQEWILLIQILKSNLDLDSLEEGEKKTGWKATPQAKFERLLRETQIPAGILSNGREIRLVYAPRGESSGFLLFLVKAMTEVAGRPILGALEMLLGADRLFNLPSDRRLPQLLADSRNYQAEVSTKLAEQVLDALWELLKGFQMADSAVRGKLLGELAKNNPQHIYGGLITTLMRLVFLLYAEDEGLIPNDSVYQCNYAVAGLFERLREDAGNYPDTMDQRYGAYSWLLSLFRLVYDGGGATSEYLPARHGQLFAPQEYPFLEGNLLSSPIGGESKEIPRIPDGVIYRILENLLILDGERLSYRSLDVEQIGSVYEAIMGYTVEVAQSPCIGVNSKPKGSKHSTTVVIDVAALLKTKSQDRAKFLKDTANCELSALSVKDLKSAVTLEEAIASLDRKVSNRTPYILPIGALYLQPTEERRRSGSHYTPRQLTQPIVETALKPIFEQLGAHPTPEQILNLKVCDLAMGSGAFLVEACRQIAEKLVEAWNREGYFPDDEPLLHARRLVAQRCLYGVDKNFFAVNLAKLSLWLVTLSKDFPFTFVDHALKCGDSLVGLTRAEIGAFAKDPLAGLPLMDMLQERVDKVKGYRQQIQALDTRTDEDTEEKVIQLQQAETELKEMRLTGKACIAAFFAGSDKKKREEKKREYADLLRLKRLETQNLPSLSQGNKSITPFNWEIEFPEVFDRKNPGFDCIVGNPPFAGKNTAINAHAEGYMDWLKEIHPESHGNADLVAHFFRRAFTLLRPNGTLGLIATNTIAQGDTRSTGLRFVCEHGGTIYHAQKRVKWPGLAAVVVSVIHIIKV